MSSNEAAFVSGLGASGLRSGLIHLLRWSAGRTIWPLTALACAVVALSAGSVDAQVVPDLVSRTALRVCADPANMPFSDRSKQGFREQDRRHRRRPAEGAGPLPLGSVGPGFLAQYPQCRPLRHRDGLRGRLRRHAIDQPLLSIDLRDRGAERQRARRCRGSR